MKLRLRQNSVRLRLLRGEVDALRSGGRIEEVITFGPASRLTYAVVAGNSGAPHATFDDGSITVELPAALARRFVESDLITIEHRQAIPGSDEPLTILIEKDFACPDRGEDPDNADAFPRPVGTCG